MKKKASFALLLGFAAACCLLFPSRPGLQEFEELGWKEPEGRRIRLLLGQRLAYDGIYDTPPVTWYFPGNQAPSNNLGYTWSNAEYQTPEVTYTPTSYSSAPTSMATAPTWSKDEETRDSETNIHYDFSGKSSDGNKLENFQGNATPEANFWQHQPQARNLVSLSPSLFLSLTLVSLSCSLYLSHTKALRYRCRLRILTERSHIMPV